MILSRVVGPGFELTVCGSISPEWLEWVRTREGPLTEGQLMWRDLARGSRPFAPVAPKRRTRRASAGTPFDLEDTEEL